MTLPFPEGTGDLFGQGFHEILHGGAFAGSDEALHRHVQRKAGKRLRARVVRACQRGPL